MASSSCIVVNIVISILRVLVKSMCKSARESAYGLGTEILVW